MGYEFWVRVRQELRREFKLRPSRHYCFISFHDWKYFWPTMALAMLIGMLPGNSLDRPGLMFAGALMPWLFFWMLTP